MIIDGRPIAFGDISLRKTESIQVVIGCASFELHNSEIDQGENKPSMIPNKNLHPTFLLLPTKIQNLTKYRPSLYKGFCWEFKVPGIRRCLRQG